MNIQTLSIFCDVARHRSFSRGAMKNSISQSAASQAIQQLEKELDTQLLDRSKRPCQLTLDGELFFKGCQDIVSRYRGLENTVKHLKKATGYTIRLASIYSVHLHDLNLHIKKFQSLMPNTTIDIDYMHPDKVYECVLNDQSELGLMSFANPRRDLTIIPWQTQKMVLACFPNHRLSKNKNGVKISDLAGESFITFDHGLSVRRKIDKFLRRHEVDIKIIAEFDNIENIKKAIEDEAGIAILPEPTLEQEVRRKDLIKIPLLAVNNDDQLVRPLSIIHRRKRHLNPIVMKFIKILCQKNKNYKNTLSYASFTHADKDIKTVPI